MRNDSEEARGWARICKSFCNKRPGSQNIKRLLLIKENQTSQVNELVLFYTWEDAKSGIIEIIPLMCTSAIWGQYPVFFSSWVSSGCTAGGGCTHSGSILSSLRAYCQGSCNVVAWWLQHPLFTDMTGNFLVHNPKEILEAFTFFPNTTEILSNQLNS